MSTLQQIRALTRSYISQTDSDNSDYTDSELNGLINQGLIFFAVQTKWPRDFISIQVEQGKDTYTLPDDNLLIYDAYFGDQNINGDVFPLTIISPNLLKDRIPNWLDNTEAAQDQPIYLTLIDRQSVLIKPTPNASSSATGKKIILYYIYYPNKMSSDADVPDLPLAYHDNLATYAAHLCYLGKLKNPEMAKTLLNDVMGKNKLLEPPVTKETEEMHFSFGSFDRDLSSDTGGGLIVT